MCFEVREAVSRSRTMRRRRMRSVFYETTSSAGTRAASCRRRSVTKVQT